MYATLVLTPLLNVTKCVNHWCCIDFNLSLPDDPSYYKKSICYYQYYVRSDIFTLYIYIVKRNMLKEYTVYCLTHFEVTLTKMYPNT